AVLAALTARCHARGIPNLNHPEPAIPSWDDLRAYARARYALEDDEAEAFSVVVGFEDQRSHKVVVRPSRAFDAPWVELRAAVCEERAMSPEDAVRRNASLPIGGLALEDGLYLLTYRLPLERLDATEFDRPVKVLARLADELERER